jgi:hypothetical protein
MQYSHCRTTVSLRINTNSCNFRTQLLLLLLLLFLLLLLLLLLLPLLPLLPLLCHHRRRCCCCCCCCSLPPDGHSPASPIGMTRVQYSRTVMLWLFTRPNTRTAMNPAAEQKAMCHTVRAMGKGKPLYARTHCKEQRVGGTSREWCAWCVCVWGGGVGQPKSLAVLWP